MRKFVKKPLLSFCGPRFLLEKARFQKQVLLCNSRLLGTLVVCFWVGDGGITVTIDAAGGWGGGGAGDGGAWFLQLRSILL